MTMIVCCPYCGKPMRLQSIGRDMYFYACTHHSNMREELDTDEICAAHGPISKTPEGAYRKAMRLNRPMTRWPMTLDEVKAHIGYMEDADGRRYEKADARPLYIEISPRLQPMVWAAANAAGRPGHCPWGRSDNVFSFLCIIAEHPDHYNRVARFWADEPTAEEKAAAKWEDEPDDEE